MLINWLGATVTLFLARLPSSVRRVARGQAAQSMVEYSIIAALVAIVALAAVTNLGHDIAGVFERIGNSVAGLGGSNP